MSAVVPGSPLPSVVAHDFSENIDPDEFAKPMEPAALREILQALGIEHITCNCYEEKDPAKQREAVMEVSKIVGDKPLPPLPEDQDDSTIEDDSTINLEIDPPVYESNSVKPAQIDKEEMLDNIQSLEDDDIMEMESDQPINIEMIDLLEDEELGLRNGLDLSPENETTEDVVESSRSTIRIDSADHDAASQVPAKEPTFEDQPLPAVDSDIPNHVTCLDTDENSLDNADTVSLANLTPETSFNSTGDQFLPTQISSESTSYADHLPAPELISHSRRLTNPADISLANISQSASQTVIMKQEPHDYDPTTNKPRKRKAPEETEDLQSVADYVDFLIQQSTKNSTENPPEKRGRGRPKGSKNRQPQTKKESVETIPVKQELHSDSDDVPMSEFQRQHPILSQALKIKKDRKPRQMNARAPVPYAIIAGLALVNAKEPISSREIYRFAKYYFPFCVTSSHWKNSIRHILCTQDYFHKSESIAGGNAFHWELNQDNTHKLWKVIEQFVHCHPDPSTYGMNDPALWDDLVKGNLGILSPTIEVDIEDGKKPKLFKFNPKDELIDSTYSQQSAQPTSYYSSTPNPYGVPSPAQFSGPPYMQHRPYTFSLTNPNPTDFSMAPSPRMPVGFPMAPPPGEYKQFVHSQMPYPNHMSQQWNGPVPQGRYMQPQPYSLSMGAQLYPQKSPQNGQSMNMQVPGIVRQTETTSLSPFPPVQSIEQSALQLSDNGVVE